MKTNSLILISGLLTLGGLSVSAGLFGPKGDTEEEKRQNVRKQHDEMMAELYTAKPEMKSRLKKAVGYATRNSLVGLGWPLSSTRPRSSKRCLAASSRSRTASDTIRFA